MTIPSLEPARLLVVDDNRVNRMALSRSLELQGHQVETAENGQEGLEKFRSGLFDLMLLDIEMPVMNGFEVLEACLNDFDLRQIPIIMTSAMEELDAVVKCVELGAEDYLTKPVNPILLRARVNASLEKKRLRDEQRKLFRTFATREVAEELLRTGFSLGGKQVTASVLFADIRSFTTIAENQNPVETIDLLNQYFSMMFDAITDNSGTVNQMMGDGLLAIFGAPIFFEDHREKAVRSALKMLERLKEFNRNQLEQGKTQLHIGIGIASGKMTVGYTGTQNRAIYTCIGDTVNLSNRIEEYTKEALRPLIVDEYTRDGLSADVKVEDLGRIIFKGKNQAVNVFAVLGA
ncbi:MAG: response regulator [Anaerolineales bacterium]|uniref:adenylate/guanylate cyclase domain-containing protein n=1 Tax=Candidatus Villigracilis vicinus TaxID=3140679 RepID=UPI003135506F|nr:response regulator [Anaerolineales bacterium]MBK7450104.1 response regulator [Anaerolineales bacterium]MBK9782122.1 response regulator [Anaerolineales bacterium]